MQTVITYIVLFFTGLCLQAQTARVEVTITGFSSNEGTALIGLYNDESTFLEEYFKGSTSRINNNTVQVVFEEIPAGEYAISVIHDENDNNKFDMTFGFIPAEDYGTSNNAKGMFGPPKWEDATFSVTENNTTSIEITMN